MTLHIDFETRSAVDLRKTGVYVYAEDASTDIWCAAYALGDDKVRLWIPGLPCPDDVEGHIRTGGTVTAHNVAFERIIWRDIFAPKYGWPEPKLEQYRCTMAMAYALALPGSLDMAAAALGLDIRKDDAGYRKMLQMSKPRKIGADVECRWCEGSGVNQDDPDYHGACSACHGTGIVHDPDHIIWWDDDERKDILYRYCMNDVEVERQLERRLFQLRPEEQRLWHIDQEINDRGVHVDEELCEASKEIAAQMKAKLDDEMKATTDNYVTRTTNANQLREWLEAQGITTDSVNKEKVSGILSREDISPAVRRALELRQAGSKTSTAKADALLRRRASTGRANGMLQYHAASTGRWGGRGFQPQNLKRPDEDTNIAEAITLIKSRNLDAMLMMYDDPISVIGDCLRGMVTAAPNKILRAADFSNIEGRVLAWLAGEQWKLDAFAAYDRKEGEDLYKVTAGNILDKPAPEITKPERQSIGKVSELALGFQGGVGAMMTMSGGRVDFAELHPMLSEKMGEHAETAAKGYEQRGHGTGVSREWWCAAEIIKLAWRATNPNIQQFWWDLEEAAIAAVRAPGSIHGAGEYIRFRKVGSFLFMQLPSNRCLAYAYPKILWKRMPWTDKNGDPVYKDALGFMGVDSVTGKWGPQDTYGGKLSENATQAVARDVLAHSLVTLHEAGWPIVLHVHDEAVTETAADVGATEELETLMSQMPAWLDGCPVSAEGWSEERYRK